MELSLQANSFSQTLAKAILRLLSWQVDVILPSTHKYVLIGAPHTSNMDFIFTLLLKYASGIKLHWVAKDTAFRWPFDGVLRWLGGIPVNRRSRNNFVQQMVEVFDQREQFIMAISPEGTRSNTDYWKTGFYYIALGAGVPIALGYIDYPDRVVGIGPAIYPTGNIQADFERIKVFYVDKRGKKPELQGEIKIRSD